MITPKFEIGNRVFSVRVGLTCKQVTCPDCLGQKEWTVNIPNGEIFQHDCQTCRCGYYSAGIVTDWGDHANIHEITIGSIQVNTADGVPVKYMCVETGIGSGSVYDEKNLHLTRHEAESFAQIELQRVAGLRQAEEIDQRRRKKREPLIHGKRKKVRA